jgi:hypothetical protein
VPLHKLAHLFTAGGGASAKQRSLVKGETYDSRVGADDPGTSSGAALEALLARLTFEDPVAATALACLTLSGCRALRAAK